MSSVHDSTETGDTGRMSVPRLSVHRWNNVCQKFQFKVFFAWYRNIPVSPRTPTLSTVSQFPKTPSQSPKHHQHKSKKKKRVQCYAQENAYVSEIGQRVLAESFYQRSLPLSRSSSASMSLLMTGPAALGSSFVRRAACSWTSSSDSSRNRP